MNSNASLGGAAKVVADKARSIVRLELALAAAELKQKLATLGVGIGLLAAAALFGVFVIGYASASIAAALATVYSTWLALLIVAGGFLVLAGILVAVGRHLISKATPPMPEQAIAEAKLTTEALSNGRH